MLAVEHNDEILVIDCGLSFPNEEMLGVDLVLPDFSYITERADQCVGVLLTHGHEDHVGALAWFLPKVDVEVFGTPLTLGIARRRLEEHGVKARFVDIAAPGRRQIGPFKCRFLAVSHSIPDAIAPVIDTPDGRILYTGDFKIDESPIDGRHTDIEGFAEVAREGVDLMLGDSTNAETPGRTPSESIVGNTLRNIFASADQRVIVACFASNLHRIQQVCEIAEEFDRRVAFIGRSMINNFEVGRELGHLKLKDRTVLPIEEIDHQPPSKTVLVCTGSQGEPLSALSLIAAGDHKFVHATKGDTVILSASAIPGNESAVHRVINSLYKAGAAVYSAETSEVHVSGHAASDELREMLILVRPKHFVPVHGEFRHLALHKKIAESVGIGERDITVVEDGDVLELTSGGVRRDGRVTAGMVLVDGLGVGDIGPTVLRDRRVLAEDGFLMCVVTIDSQSGEILAGPDLISRGFVHMDESREWLDEAADRVHDALERLEGEHVTDWQMLKKTCRRALGEFVWHSLRRRPMILPVIMEI
ncbi:MAG: RNase J family beta-CASP ribonuclease [Actinobacteria bacterium]|nr:RNase J family beta-CASP ribonuclease [Actinomycetota bacterium]